MTDDKNKDKEERIEKWFYFKERCTIYRPFDMNNNSMSTAKKTYREKAILEKIPLKLMIMKKYQELRRLPAGGKRQQLWKKIKVLEGRL